MTSNASHAPPPSHPPINFGHDSYRDCVEAGNVPSPTSLASQYKHWLENSVIQQFRDKYNQADACLDLAALGGCNKSGH